MTHPLTSAVPDGQVADFRFWRVATAGNQRNETSTTLSYAAHRGTCHPQLPKPTSPRSQKGGNLPLPRSPPMTALLHKQQLAPGRKAAGPKGGIPDQAAALALAGFLRLFPCNRADAGARSDGSPSKSAPADPEVSGARSSAWTSDLTATIPNPHR
jgi:hypothetical protein